MYNNGKNKEAFKYALEEAQKGNSTAQHSVGYLYYNGEGVTQDKNEAFKWYSKAAEQGNAESQCCIGFNMEQTDKLLHGQTVNYSGWLHSNEYRRNALADNVTAQVIRDEKRNLFLHINETPIAQWFKEHFRIGQEQRRGFKM